MNRVYQNVPLVKGHEVNDRILRALKANDEQHQRTFDDQEREIAELRRMIRNLQNAG